VAAGCFHCGSPLSAPRRATLLGAERDICCAGCEAVALTIARAGLGAYYETRSAPAQPLAPLAPIESEAQDRDHASLILERVRCAACLWLIEQALRREPHVAEVSVNYATRRAQVRWIAEKTSLAAIIGAIRAVGYDASPYAPCRAAQLERRERRSALWRLFVAGFGAMQVMMYAFPAYVDDIGTEASQLMRWASLFLTLPVILFSCGPFFAGARQELRSRRLGLETPVTSIRLHLETLKAREALTAPEAAEGGR
jgi:P-type Cu2+ transporter